MVAVFTGLGAGFERGSFATLGGVGLLGSAAHGRGNDRVSVNAATGNLIIGGRDEFLVGLGRDFSAGRTYNSLGQYNDNDHWRQTSDRELRNLVGTENAADSTIDRISSDGSVITYLYNGDSGRYETTDGGGAHDNIEYDEASSAWTWTDGATQVTEEYEAHNGTWRIISVTSADNHHSQEFIYEGDKLARVWMPDDDDTNTLQDFVSFIWTGNVITEIVTGRGDRTASSGANSSTDITLHTRTRYGYDSHQRLISVTTDLSPEDNVISDDDGDGNVEAYTSTYTYEGNDPTDVIAFNLVKTLTQTDGTELSFSYDATGRVTQVRQAVEDDANGVVTEERVTNYEYFDAVDGVAHTRVIDPRGFVTTLYHLAETEENAGQLVKIESAEDIVGGRRQNLEFIYDADGNVTRRIQTSNVSSTRFDTQFEYDDRGNLTRIIDPTGVTVEREYDDSNNLIRETETLTDLIRLGEDGLTGQWQGDPDSVGGVNANNEVSNGVLAMDLSVAGASGFGTQDVITAVDGTTYQFSIEVRVSGDYDYNYTDAQGNTLGLPFNFQMRVLDGSYNAHSTPRHQNVWGQATDLGAGWVRLEGSYTAQAGDGYLRPWFYKRSSLSADAPGDAQLELRNLTVEAGSEGTDGLFEASEEVLNASNLQWADLTSNAYGSPDAVGALSGVWEFSGNVISFDLDDANWAQVGTSNVVAAEVGQTYRLSVEVSVTNGAYVIDENGNIVGGAGFNPQVRILDANYQLVRPINAWSNATHINAGWVRIEYEFVAREGDVYLRPWIYKRPSLNSAVDGNGDSLEGTMEVRNLAIAVVSDAQQRGHARNVYNDNNQLEYSVSAEGRVKWYRYNPLGQVFLTAEFPDDFYSTSRDVPTVAELDAWRNGLDDHTTAQTTRIWYDHRGNVRETRSYDASVAAETNNGDIYAVTQDLSSDFSRTLFTYDSAGQLLSRRTLPNSGAATETFVYDGLGRMISATNTSGVEIETRFNDSDRETVVVNMSNNYATTSVYNHAGDIISFDAPAISGQLATDRNYIYDQAGRLVAQSVKGRVDNGVQLNDYTYFVYDNQNRLVGEISHTRGLIEYQYDDMGRMVGTIRYQLDVPLVQLERFKDEYAHLIADDPVDTDVARAAFVDINDLRPATHVYDIREWSVFDDAGRVIQTIMGDGSVVDYIYDGQGRLETTIGYTEKLKASALAQIESNGAPAEPFDYPADWETNLQSNEYEQWDELSEQITSDDFSITRVFYDRDDNVIGTLNPEGYLSRNIYDAAGQLIEVVAYASPTLENLRASGSFDALVASINGDIEADFRNHQVYDGQGNLRFSIDHEGYVTEFVYSADGDADQDANGLVRRTITYATAIGTITDYSLSNVKTVVEGIVGPEDRETRSIYDSRGRLAFTIAADGAVSRLIYNAQGLVERTINYAKLYDGPAASGLPTYGEISTWTVTGSNGSGARQAWTYYTDAGLERYVVDAEGYVTSFEYDGEGRVIEQSRWADPVSGNSINASTILSGAARAMLVKYDASGRQQSVTDATGAVTDYVYYRNGALHSEIRNAGHNDQEVRTRFIYDNAGKLFHKIHDFQGSDHVVTRLIYDGRGNVIQQIEAVNSSSDARSTYFEYDRSGRVVKTTDALGGETYNAYNGFGQLISTTDALGRETIFAYDELGRLERQTDAEGGVTMFAYSAFGELLSQTDARGFTTQYAYDDLGRQISMTNARGETISNTYNAFGQVLTSTDARNEITYFTYDDLGRVSTVTDAEGGVSYSYYDDYGQLSLTVDARGFATSMTYFEDGNLNTVINHLVSVQSTLQAGVAPIITTDSADIKVSYVYDLNKNVVLTVDGLGAETHNYYDALNRLIMSVDAEGYVTSHAYNKVGETVSSTRHAVQLDVSALQDGGDAPSVSMTGSITTYNYYDDLGRLTHSVDGERGLSEYTYDAVGNVVRTIRHADAVAAGIDLSNWSPSATGAPAAGDIVSYSYYDELGRITLSVDPEGGVSSYTYDANGNVLSATQYADAFGGTPSIDGTQAQADIILNAITVDAVNDRTTHNYYDQLGRVTTTVDGERGRTSYNYDSVGNIVRTIRHVYSVSQHTDLATWQPTPPQNPDMNDSVVYSYYDGLGRTVLSVDPEGGVTSYTYDANGNVSSATQYEDTLTGTAGVNGTEAEADAIFAAISVDVLKDRTSHNYYDVLGRLTHSVDAEGYVSSYTYDATGNVIATVRHAEVFTGTGIPALSIDDDTDAISQTWYDSLGRATTTVDAEGYVTTYAYDSLGNVAETVRFEDALSSLPSIGASEPVAIANSGNDAVTTYKYDALGRAVLTIDAGGYVSASNYDALGNMTASTRYIGDYAVDRTADAASIVTNLNGDTNVTASTTINTFDAMGRLETETLPITSELNGAQVQIVNRFEYDAFGNLSVRIEADGFDEERITSYAYDRLGRLTVTSHPSVAIYADGLDSVGIQNFTPTETLVYDTFGNVIEATDQSGARTLFWYDQRGNLTAELSALGTLSRHWYQNGFGQVSGTKVYADLVPISGNRPSIQPPSGTDFRWTTFGYDRLGRMTQSRVKGIQTGAYDGTAFTTQTNDLITSYKFDAFNNVTETTDPNGNKVYTWFDARGLKTDEVDAEGYLTVWTHDSDGNVVSETRYANAVTVSYGAHTEPVPDAANDRVTTYAYDALGRKLNETRIGVEVFHQVGTGASATYTTQTVDAKLIYEYNALGQVTKRIEATGDETLYIYDAGGRLISEVREGYQDFEGNTVTPTLEYEYDALGNVTRTLQRGTDNNVEIDDRIVANAYDGAGRLATSTDAAGFVRTYAYDAMGRIVREAYDRSNALDDTLQTEAMSYTYDLEGRVLSQGLISETNGVWAHNDDASEMMQMTYNAFGDVATRGVNGIVSEQFDYDAAGRVWHTTSGDGLSKYFMYDANGNQTLAISSVGYDFNHTVATTIDNILALWTGSDVLTHSANDVVATLTRYDARNMAVESKQPRRELAAGGTLTDIISSQTYNAFGELSSQTDARGYTTDFTYNAMGRLIKTERPEVAVWGEDGTSNTERPTEHIYYDASGRQVASRDANGNLTRMTLVAGTGYGSGQALVTRLDQADTTQKYIWYDVHGDARIQTDATDLFQGQPNNSNGANESFSQFLNRLERKTEFAFDGLGRVTQITRAATQAGQLIEYFAYDGLGQQTNRWTNFYGDDDDLANVDINAQAVTQYDLSGRVTSQRAVGGDTTTYAYTWDGSINAATNFETATDTVFGAWTTVTTYANTKTLTETKDRYGRQLAKTDLGGRNFAFAYDNAGRLIETSGTSVATRSYTYLNTGRMAESTITGTTYDTWSFAYVANDYGNWNPLSYTAQTKSTSYEYDANGNIERELLDENDATVRDNTASYDALGRLLTWSSAAIGASNSESYVPAASTTYAYDANGNIRSNASTFATLQTSGGANAATTDTLWYTYDAMNRVLMSQGELENGAIVLGYGSSAISYTAAGERFEVIRRASDSTSFQYYYAGPGPSGVYVIEDTPRTGQTSFQSERAERYEYDNSGRLINVSTALREHTEIDGPIGGQYSDEGVAAGVAAQQIDTLWTWKPFETISNITYDAFGRQTHRVDSLLGGQGATNVTRAFNEKGQVTVETTIQLRGDKEYRTINTYDYGTSNEYSLGAANIITTENSDRDAYSGSWTDRDDTRIYNAYEWWDGAVQSRTIYDPDFRSGGPEANYSVADAIANGVHHTQHTTNYNYDEAGTLQSARITDGRNRTVSYTSDVNGQIVERDEADGDYTEGDPREIWYRFAGRQMGYVGNNGGSNDSYVSSVQASTIAPSSGADGAFRNNASNGIAASNFDQSYYAFNSNNQGSSAGNYTVRAGDTLAGIASGMWGDASLWYKLAEANGLSASSNLAAGTTLTIPAGVVRNTNNATTFQPYNPNEAIGDTSPTTPEPPKDGKDCGAGQILMVVVAVVVATIVTAGVAGVIGAGGSLSGFGAGVAGLATNGLAVGGWGAVAAGAIGGAAGSIASQGVGLLTNTIDEFSWNSVATSAIGGAVGASGFGSGAANALGATTRGFVQSAISGAASNVLTQGLTMAVGLQSKFNWTGVAAAGIAAGVTQVVSDALPGYAVTEPLTGNVIRQASWGNQFASSAVGALSNAATRTAIDGSNFGDNVIAAIPDVVGNAIGSLINNGISEKLAEVLDNKENTENTQFSDPPPSIASSSSESESARTPDYAGFDLSVSNSKRLASSDLDDELNLSIFDFDYGDSDTLPSLNIAEPTNFDELGFNLDMIVEIGLNEGDYIGFPDFELPLMDIGREAHRIFAGLAVLTNVAISAGQIDTHLESGYTPSAVWLSDILATQSNLNWRGLDLDTNFQVDESFNGRPDLIYINEGPNGAWIDSLSGPKYYIWELKPYSDGAIQKAISEQIPRYTEGLFSPGPSGPEFYGFIGMGAPHKGQFGEYTFYSTETPGLVVYTFTPSEAVAAEIPWLEIIPWVAAAGALAGLNEGGDGPAVAPIPIPPRIWRPEVEPELDFPDMRWAPSPTLDDLLNPDTNPYDDFYEYLPFGKRFRRARGVT